MNIPGFIANSSLMEVDLYIYARLATCVTLSKGTEVH